MNKIGIIGATGYTGSELVRLLYSHPDVEIEVITSDTFAGQKFSDIHPQFRGIIDFELQSAEEVSFDNLDLVFLALPHGVAMEYVKKLMDTDVKIVDLSGDFRLSSREVYEKWYNKEHIFEEGFEKAIFGIPELFESEIKNAKLIANPGCFPTGAILALAPLVKNKLIKPEHIIIDSKTGVTGAGVKPKVVTHFPNVNDNFKPYGVKNHRHTIEIQEQLGRLFKNELTVQFTPHLLPVDRGILTSAYATPASTVTEENIKDMFYEFYKNDKFIRVIDNVPELKNVRATNYVDIYPVYDERTNNIMVFSAMDNLVKGAAGQAIQNMNLMLRMEQSKGLLQIPVNP
jgi:N-acetyl-gamma-glutamyl-phosphate reductase